MNVIYGIACLFSGFFAAYAVRNLISPANFQDGRHANLNGLRGFLSLIMFVCHAATWQQYLEDGQWRVSSSPFLIIPGQTGIAIFFMITGFLFAKKYLDSKNQQIDWVKVYCSRFFRLYPAYLFSMLLLFSIVAASSFYSKSTENNINILSYLKWILFTIPGAPALNGLQDTNIMMAGITWSLTFEWAFYFSLPILAAVLGTKISWPAIAFGAAMLLTTLYFIPFYGLVYFMILLGVLSAIVDKYANLQDLLNTKIAGILAIALLIFNGFINNQTSYTATSIALIGVAFMVFAAGNTLSGFLNSKAIQIFGLGTYSIYLLHGPLLYITFKLIQKNNYEIYKSNEGFWLIILVLSPILVIFSIFSYVFIEVPSMKHHGKFAKKIHAIFNYKFSTKQS